MSDDPGPDTDRIQSVELPHVESESARPFEVAVPPQSRIPLDLSTQPPGPHKAEAEQEDPVLAAVRALIFEHERKEKESEERAARERASMGEKLDRLAVVVDSLFDDKVGIPAFRRFVREDFEEVAERVAQRIANPFLEQVQEWISALHNVKQEQQQQTLRLTQLEKLGGRVESLERELKEVRAEIDRLTKERETSGGE